MWVLYDSVIVGGVNNGVPSCNRSVIPEQLVSGFSRNIHVWGTCMPVLLDFLAINGEEWVNLAV